MLNPLFLTNFSEQLDRQLAVLAQSKGVVERVRAIQEIAKILCSDGLGYRHPLTTGLLFETVRPTFENLRLGEIGNAITTLQQEQGADEAVLKTLNRLKRICRAAGAAVIIHAAALPKTCPEREQACRDFQSALTTIENFCSFRFVTKSIRDPYRAIFMRSLVGLKRSIHHCCLLKWPSKEMLIRLNFVHDVLRFNAVEESVRVSTAYVGFPYLYYIRRSYPNFFEWTPNPRKVALFMLFRQLITYDHCRVKTPFFAYFPALGKKFTVWHSSKESLEGYARCKPAPIEGLTQGYSPLLSLFPFGEEIFYPPLYESILIDNKARVSPFLDQNRDIARTMRWHRKEKPEVYLVGVEEWGAKEKIRLTYLARNEQHGGYWYCYLYHLLTRSSQLPTVTLEWLHPLHILNRVSACEGFCLSSLEICLRMTYESNRPGLKLFFLLSLLEEQLQKEPRSIPYCIVEGDRREIELFYLKNGKLLVHIIHPGKRDFKVCAHREIEGPWHHILAELFPGKELAAAKPPNEEWIEAVYRLFSSPPAQVKPPSPVIAKEEEAQL